MPVPPQLSPLLASASRLGRHFPMPTLNAYFLLSVLLFLATVHHVHSMVVRDDQLNDELRESVLNATRHLPISTRLALADSLVFRILCYAVSDSTLIWVVLNSICCCFAFAGRLMVWFVFGQLRTQETSMLRERVCNLLIFKLVFVFGVLSSHLLEELVVWALWISALTPLTLLVHLSLHRLKYILSSVASEGGRGRLFVLSCGCVGASLLLTVASMASARYFGLNYALFLFADASMLLLRAVHCCIRCGLSLPRMASVSVDSSQSLLYHLELAFDVAIDCLDLAHHLHMLLWAQIALSLICLLIFLQMRYIYQRLHVRVRRHANYRRISAHIHTHYLAATANELSQHADACAICWETMRSARRLPCAHLFHEWCLRAWLEQDPSCPTCRMPLSIVTANEAAVRATDEMRAPFNHFFHFNGRRYARWLPSFSVEVSHNLGASAFFNSRQRIADSQLSTMAEQVREMFPQWPVEVILDDLRESGSAQATIENILENRLSTIGIDGDDGDEFDEDEDDSSLVSATREAQLHVQMDSEMPSTSSFTSFARSDEFPPDRRVSPERDSTGTRFSKSSDERQTILEQRKRALIDRHRRSSLLSNSHLPFCRRYLASERGANLRASASIEQSRTGADEEEENLTRHRRPR